MKRLTLAGCCLLATALAARAQFSAKWLQDDAYWGDGKAEFNIYDAQEVRYGQPRPSEVIHILVREPFSRDDLVKAEPGSKAATYPVLKLNQILHIPTGIYVYQQMHSAFWRVEDSALIKATLTSNDSCGNTFKEFRALSPVAALFGRGWRYEWRTYWEGMSAGQESIHAPKDAIFYDELPMRVRTIDFSEKESGELALQLAPSIVNSKKDAIAFKAAHIRWKRSGDTVELDVFSLPTAGKGAAETRVQRFALERRPPYRLLKSWSADGDALIPELTLRRSLKIDYWNYNKPGDKERALGSSSE